MVKLTIPVVALLLAAVSASPAAFAQTLLVYDDFSGDTVDEAKWVIDTDNGYEIGLESGALRIYNPKVSGSHGPSDGLASTEPHLRWSVDVTPYTLHTGDEMDEHQMVAIYLAQDEGRGAPYVAFGFVADPKNSGAARLVFRGSGDDEWQVARMELPLGQTYTLSAVYDADGERVQLYFGDALVGMPDDITYESGAPHLVLRTGSWDGLVPEEIEGRYDNVRYGDDTAR